MGYQNLEQVTVSLEREDLKTLKHLAVDDDRTLSEFLRILVRDYLNAKIRIGTRAAGPDQNVA